MGNSIHSNPVILTSVGDGIFGEFLMQSLQRSGVPAGLRANVRLNEYWRAKGKPSRIGLRLRMYGLYPLATWWRILREDPRVYIATTNPFFLPLLVGHAARRRRPRVIQWMYDLYPDALVAAGGLGESSLVARLLAKVTRRSLRQSQATVYLGRRLAAHSESAYGPSRFHTIIPIGSDARPFMGVPAALAAGGTSSTPRSLTILYSGHFGRMHDPITLAETLHRLGLGNPAAQGPRNGPGPSLSPAQLQFRFRSSGPNLGWFTRRMTAREGSGAVPVPDGATVPLRWTLDIGDNLPEDDWVQQMREAEVALVTMTAGAEKVVMPSKAYSAMMAGQAIIAVAPLESDLADTVLEHDCGWVVVPHGLPAPSVPTRFQGRVFTGVDGLMRVLGEIVARPEELRRRRINAARAGHERYAMDVLVKQWIDLLAELEARGT